MSENVTKAGLRIKLNPLSGKPIREIKEFFDEREIEPEYYDEEYDELYYSAKKNAVTPMMKDGDVYIDYLLIYDNPSYNQSEMDLSFDDMKEITVKLSKEYPFTMVDVRVFAYTWYNGCEEPFYN